MGISRDSVTVVIQDAVLGSQLGTIAGPFDDDLMRGVRQAIQCAIAQNWVVEQCQPFVDASI